MSAYGSSIFVVAVGVVALEAVLPDHTGSGHAQRLEHLLLHQFVERLFRDGLHYQLQKVDAFT